MNERTNERISIYSNEYRKLFFHSYVSLQANRTVEKYGNFLVWKRQKWSEISSQWKIEQNQIYIYPNFIICNFNNENRKSCTHLNFHTVNHLMPMHQLNDCSLHLRIETDVRLGCSCSPFHSLQKWLFPLLFSGCFLSRVFTVDVDVTDFSALFYIAFLRNFLFQSSCNNFFFDFTHTHSRQTKFYG